MRPLGAFDLDGNARQEIAEGTSELPKWLAGILEERMALQLFHFARTGSIRRRLFALSQCASILARLHSAGLVYGDISANNVFISEGSSPTVWLIDADNLRFELLSGGTAVYTPGYGAPEVVRGADSSRPRSDCWAFAVMAFKTLALCHPFIGKKVLEPDNEVGWDADPVMDGAPADLDEQAYAGYFPFVDDHDDESNRGVCGLPRELVTTPGIRLLFQETFGAGRMQPHRRPMMFLWALELTKAFDLSLECPQCKMSYFAEGNKQCPYCGTARPAFICAKTSRWEVLIPAGATEFELPHRMFHPFSFDRNHDAEYEAVLDFAARMASPVRGTKQFPDELVLDFIEAEK
jgi:serine/threonine protein kinase